MQDNELIKTLSGLIAPVEIELKKISKDVTEVKKDLTEVKIRVGKVEEGLEEVSTRVGKVEEGLEEVSFRIKKVEVAQEIDIIPRLQNIEACYTSTYDRYKESVDDYNMMKMDISILKSTVTDHSQMLQKIS